MFLNEELLTDDRYLRLNKNRQSELIAGHCADIKDRIRSAPSRQEAIRFKETVCSKFRQECRSTVIRTALIEHVDGLIAQYWDNKEI